MSNEVVEKTEVKKVNALAYVILKSLAGRESEGAEGADELAQRLADGFEAFAVTSYAEQRDATKIMGGKPQVWICDKIWLRKSGHEITVPVSEPFTKNAT